MTPPRPRGRWASRLALVLVVLLGGSATAPLWLGALAVQATMVAAASPDEIAANRELWVAGDPVVDIYGMATGQPVRLLFPDRARLVHPVEDPSLTLYLVDKQKGENPLQLKSVEFLARWATVGLGGALVLVLGWLAWQRRRT